jgi:hypothetical protein
MKWLGAIVGGACFVAGVLMYNEMKYGYSADVDKALDRAVKAKYAEEEATLKMAVSDAAAEAGSVIRAEENDISQMLNSNSEYQTAKAVVEVNGKQIDQLKKALEVAKKGNTTQVAVGSGSSAVAVSVKDTSQITQLQSDISKLEIEKKLNQKTVELIRKDAQVKVRANRTAEQNDILAKHREAQKNLSMFNVKKETYKNELRDDPDFFNTTTHEAFKKNVTLPKVIGSATLQSVPFVLILAWIWADAIESIQCIRR